MTQRSLIVFLALVVAWPVVVAGQAHRPKASTVTNLPVTCEPAGKTYIVTDGADTTDCDTGGGSEFVHCVCDAAGTGYVAVGDNTVVTVEWHAATCIGATATLNLDDTPNLTEPAAACATFGSSPNGITFGVAVFDPGTDEGGLVRFELRDWDSAEDTDLDFIWYSADTGATEDVVWGVSTSCRGLTQVWNATWNTANTVTDPVQTIAGSSRNLASLTAITMTGCQSDETFFAEIFRDANIAADDAPSDAQLVSVVFKYRRQK